MNIVFLGEITGKSGVFAVKSTLREIKARYAPDFIIANTDSTTGGAGLGVQHAVYLKKLGLDCLTIGESAYFKLDMTGFYPKAPWVLRPANYPYDNPGRGYRVFQTERGKIAVIVLLGQAGFSRVHLENPFHTIDRILERVSKDTASIIVDFHAATTAEKLTFAAYLDGKVSAVIGSHCKALTADARILQKGTAAITDSGRCGSILSVGGMDPAAKIREYMTSVRTYMGDGTEGLESQGCALTIDENGRATAMESFRIPCKEQIHD